VLKPGGTAAILAWSSEQLLPGYPGLEARLKSTTPGLAPFSAKTKPEEHFLRGTGILKQAGFAYVSIKSFLGDVKGPLDDKTRIALEELLSMRWPGAEGELAKTDADLFKKLISPDSEEHILDQKDYYAFFTYTLLFGVKGE
jgi:demethylmenaquinone methyltransferase/2-methoxy-6-polyprenyl-1,4-benzoquinol methylase